MAYLDYQTEKILYNPTIFFFNMDLKQSGRMKNHQNGNNNKKVVEKTHACKATQERPGILSWI